MRPPTARAPAEAAPTLTLNALDLDPTMADSNFAATPYPTYNLGGDDDSIQHAVLTAHAGASVERNQDAQFAALSRQNLQGRVSDGRRESVETKYEAVVAQKDFEIRQSERFSELKDLIRAQSERDLAEARAELRAERAAGENKAIQTTLAAILAKLSA